jgi:hypothetical protein
MSNSSVGTLYSLSLESSDQARMRVGNHVTLISCSYNQILCSVASNIAILSRNIDRLIALANCNRREQIAIDHLRNRLNFDLNKSRQKFHHSLKEHHKISNIPKFRCEML